MKRLVAAAGIAAMVYANAPSAELSSTVTFASQYVFRGISQTDEEAAVQGSIDYAHDSGWYAGVWGSNVDFNDNDQAHLEIDWYAGYAAELAGGLGYDLGVIYYSYPGAASDLEYDFVEATAALLGEFASVSWDLRANYSPEFFAESGDAYYLQLNGSMELADNLSGSLHVGMQAIDDNATFGADDYVDWAAGVAATLAGLDWSLQYLDTDLDEAECFGGTQLCDDRFLLSASRSF